MLNNSEIDIERLQKDHVLTEEAKIILGQRVELLVRADSDENVRAAMMKACTDGMDGLPGYLYFFMMLACIFEPRNLPGMQMLPFVPYLYQVEELAIIHRMVQNGIGVTGKRSTKLDLKSRDMGDTWIHLQYFLWDFLFNRGSFHLGSFKEEEVDKLGSHNTLFGKLRKSMNALPKWALPKDLVDKMLLLSYGNDEVNITGESANEGFGRSKRCKGVLMDEFQNWENDRAAYQSVSSTSNVIFLVGTPQGFGNYYSEIARKKQIKAAIIRTIHWHLHPLKAHDLEWINGKPTSTWYRDQVAELPPEVVAAELDLSFETSVKGPVFADKYGAGHQKKGLKLLPGIPVIRAWDPGGGWFGVLLLQITKDRRVRVYRECLLHGHTLDDMAMDVKKASEELARASYQGNQNEFTYKDWYEFIDVGDPSGATISKANQVIPEYQELQQTHDITVDYMFMAEMPTEIRVRARIIQILNCMQRHISSQNPDLDGPALIIDIDGCPTLDEALRGGYRRKIDANGNVLDAIEKRHPYNEVVDCLGYGIVSELGIPEQIKREQKRLSEEKKEDEDAFDEENGYSKSGGRSRC